MDIENLYEEVTGYLSGLSVDTDGEHLWDNFQKVTAILIRLTAIRTSLAWEEVQGRATSEEKKFRTMIIDPTIERFQEVARFESRKISARAIEAQMEK
jgi:hypothetical protein